MRCYKFYDTDALGHAEYDIAGIQYQLLLNLCFRYCSTVSLRINITFHDPLYDQIEQYRIPVTNAVLGEYLHYHDFRTLGNVIHDGLEIRHYALCPEMIHLLSNTTDSIFKWIYGWGFTNPEDPVFYRNDGSVFFASIIHEGECTLYPRENEDISAVLNCGGWFLIDENGVPRAPAIENQLPPPCRNDILEDPFFNALMQKHSEYEQDPLQKTIENLIDFIEHYRPADIAEMHCYIHPQASFLPMWYLPFCYYALGQCDALINTDLPTALQVAGYSGESAYNRFFELLHQYVYNICPP